jgi:L-iditol 2-dehydrogenase
MEAVEITGRRQVRIVDKPMPRIARDYVLIKVVAAPMCNEYLAYTEGVYLERNRPDSLGHEIAGEVVAAPAGASVSVGDRVVALCGYPCGRCSLCKSGHYSYCPHPDDPRQVCSSESGECGFAQYAIKPDWMLEKIPHELSFEHASMACCGLGPTFGAMERLGVTAESTVLITGLGAVGLGGIINAKARGAEVIAAVRSPYRAQLGRALGCQHIIGPSCDEVMRVTENRGVDYVIECSGQQIYQRLAIDAVARLGGVAFLAEPGVIEIAINDDLIQRGVAILGSLDINRADLGRLLAVISSVQDQLELYITHRLPLARAGEAFEAQAIFRSGKILLRPWNNAS